MTKTIHPITSFKFWQAYWITMRPYLLFVSAVAGMAGFAASSNAGLGATIGALLAFFLSYGFGQALTDCFQTDTDSISSPYRPLIQGVITKNQVLSISLIGLFGCCLILFALNPGTLILGLLSVFGLATYTYFKRRWWAGPFYNAWIVALLPIIGKMAADGMDTSIADIFENRVLIPIVISVFFSYANFVLMGYFKDISADRASGYRTFVVAYGWKKAAIGSDLFALVSITATGWGISMVLLNDMAFSSRWISVTIFLAAIVMLIFAQLGIHRVNDEKEAHRPITNVVRGFLLLHLTEACLLRPGWLVCSLIFYILFELTLKTRPEKGQV